MRVNLRNMTSVYLVREGEILCLYRIGSRVASNRYIGSAGGHFEKEENGIRACALRGTTGGVLPVVPRFF